MYTQVKIRVKKHLNILPNPNDRLQYLQKELEDFTDVGNINQSAEAFKEWMREMIDGLERQIQMKTSAESNRDQGLKTYPDKWYAFYHWILIKCGKVKPIEGSKTEIIKFGQNKYGTGEGFYKEYKDFDMNNIPAYINSLSQKDRHKWKGIIKDISKNDNDVLLWLKKQPK
jgi:hypothetical protein